MSQFNIDSLEHGPEHGGADGSGFGSREKFLDYDPILPSWPPDESWVALPGVWSDRQTEQRLPASRSAQG